MTRTETEYTRLRADKKLIAAIEHERERRSKLASLEERLTKEGGELKKAELEITATELDSPAFEAAVEKIAKQRVILEQIERIIAGVKTQETALHHEIAAAKVEFLRREIEATQRDLTELEAETLPHYEALFKLEGVHLQSAVGSIGGKGDQLRQEIVHLGYRLDGLQSASTARTTGAELAKELIDAADERARLAALPVPSVSAKAVTDKPRTNQKSRLGQGVTDIMTALQSAVAML